jgi:hypothetical protein
VSDPLSIRQCAFTHALALLILEAERLGYQVKVQELNRDLETQKKYVAEGKSKTLDSRHLDKLAADIVLFRAGSLVEDQEAFRPLGVYWESLGGRWGGRFGFESQPKEIQDAKLGWDPNHFEMRRS